MTNDDKPRDSFHAFRASLDLFASGFSKNATTPDQVKLAGQFKDFVKSIDPTTLGLDTLSAVERDQVAKLRSEQGPADPNVGIRLGYTTALTQNPRNIDMNEPGK